MYWNWLLTSNYTDVPNLYLTHLFHSQEKNKILLYKLTSDPPRIKLYFDSSNYGEDPISYHIVGCYLFQKRCGIRHSQGIWGKYCNERNIMLN